MVLVQCTSRLQTFSVWKSLKFVVWERGNSLPTEKFKDWSKFKAFADKKIKSKSKAEFLFGIGRKYCGKKEIKLVTSIFSFSLDVFKRLLLQGR